MSLKTPWEKLEVPKKIIHKLKTIIDVYLIAKYFHSYCTEIGPNLANKIEKLSINLEGYYKKCSSVQPEHRLSINELKDVIFSLGINESPDFDSISFTPLIVLLSFINHCCMYPNYI